MRFYYFLEAGAFQRDETTGTYRVHFEKMKEAMISLSEYILKVQGDGDYEAARRMLEEKGFIREELQNDLNRIGEAGIPRDIVFEQGAEAWPLIQPEPVGNSPLLKCRALLSTLNFAFRAACRASFQKRWSMMVVPLAPSAAVTFPFLSTVTLLSQHLIITRIDRLGNERADRPKDQMKHRS